MRSRIFTLSTLFVLLAGVLSGQATRVITDADLVAGGTYDWSADTVYQLDGYVFLEAGGVLNIEAGTRVEGLAVPSDANDLASTLIIARDAQINATGTAASPIVFTAEDEDGTFEIPADRGSWGGLIILGNATVGEENSTGLANIEGIPVEDRTTYGGGAAPNDADDSGTLTYVSIRYGGATLANDNEINGLTLGGVGNGTTIEYIEVFGNTDDGIEFFGGSVDVKNAVVAFCGDDSFDSDQAWSGRGQFWFTIQLPNDPSGNNQNGGEHDGSEDPNDDGPVQTVYNATYIGMGSDMDNGESNTGLRIKSGGAISYTNSIIYDFGKDGLRLQDNAYDRYLNDEFILENNLWFEFGDGNDPADFVRVDDGDDATPVITKLVADGNQVVDPLLNGISRVADGGLDPRPGSGSPARTGAATPADAFFTPTTYRGAFSPFDNWATGWTHMDELGYFGDLDMSGNTIVIDDADLIAGGQYTWTSDNVYVLDGYVFLEEGGCLNIEAGTRIEGLAVPTNANDLASTLIIARGAQIKAEGTEDAPIVFTAEGEDGTFEIPADRGAWGGLIILGNATVGEENSTGLANIEGIPVEARTTYGGGAAPNDADNSGVLRYVSIRYGGATLANDNEINGLTLGGVGNGTEIEYIEVFGNTDDGIEFFGGSVDVKNAVVAFCGDDSFDTDQAWSGRGQFWFTIQLPNDPSGNNQNGGEHDGSEDPNDDGPVQTVYNATYIGMGADMDNGESNTGLRIKSGGAISYTNSIIYDFGKDGLRLQDNAYDRFLADEFDLANNIWFEFGDGNDPADFVRVDDGDDAALVIAELVADGNDIVDPNIAGISRIPNGMLDPRPSVGSPAFQNIADVPDDGFFQPTGFRGAFAFGNNWARNWTHMDELGYFGDLVADRPTNVITDADLVGGQTYNWSADTIYVLDGYVFLEEGGCLNIAPGTIIQGGATPSDPNDLSSALIISRGAQIKAEGTAEQPIVFTAEGEDGNFEIPADRGSWGGLIVLGNATVGDENSSGLANIEGIPVEDRTTYGGGATPNDADDSGILTYVSIRYGGATLANDNEINGLTLGGVGSGTTIENIEVFGNTDDGIEFFGGSVDVKYASVIFCGDDSFDSDQAWSGRGQFWFTLQLPNDPSGNNQNGGEHDGSEDPNDDGPVQTVWNATYIGMGADMDNGESNTGLRIKSGAAIDYGNSIFTEFGKDGLRLQDNAYDRYLNDEFDLLNNLWWNFGDGNAPTDFVRVDDGDDVALVIAELLADGNEVTDPQLFRINWTASADQGADGNGTDPRPLSTSPATINAADLPNEDFYTDVDFRGAFAPSEDAADYWVSWTHAYELGYLVDQLVGAVDFGQNNTGVVLGVPSPNPTNGITTLSIELPEASQTQVAIYDQVGRMLTTYNLGLLVAGENQYTLDLSDLPNGNYYLIMQTDLGAIAQRVVVSH